MKAISRRTFLRGAGATGPAFIALPVLDAMLDVNGRAWAGAPVASRFVLWFNGNGVPEKYWIPRETGPGFALTPCLAPLAGLLDDVQIVTGLDNLAATEGRGGNGHTNSMSGLMSGKGYTGRGAGGPSVDQVIAGRVGGNSRFRSLQVGVANESFGLTIQRNMSWAAADRPLAPEMLPTRLFDRLFGQRDLGWVQRQKSVLDAVREDATGMAGRLGARDRARLDEHLSSVRELERAIASAPPVSGAAVAAPETGGDLQDWPRLAKLQSDLTVQALATHQTRVVSYMLTKCQSLTRFPWLGHTVLRHHDYTHYDRVPGTMQPAQYGLRDICRWKVEELAYFLGRLKSIPEGDGTLLDHTCVLFLHEHAEGNDHKNRSLGMVLAGMRARLKTGVHTRVAGTMGDLYVTLADDVMGADIKSFPTYGRRLTELLRSA